MCSSVFLWMLVHLSSSCLHWNNWKLIFLNNSRIWTYTLRKTTAPLHLLKTTVWSLCFPCFWPFRVNIQSQIYFLSLSLPLRLGCCWMSHCVGCWRTLVSVAADCCHRNLGLHILPGIPTQWNTLSLTSWRCSCTQEHANTHAHAHMHYLKGFPGCRGVLFLGSFSRIHYEYCFHSATH